jgi:TusA-related sulfurtransferase
MSLFAMAFRFGGTGLGRREEGTETTIEAGEKEVELPGHDRLKIAVSLNFIGDTCLRTNLVTKKALAYSLDGDVIAIITDNPSSAETIPFMLPDYDCVHLATIHEVEHWKIYIGKGKTQFKHFAHAL